METVEFLTIAGSGAVIVALVEAIKRTAGWDEATTNRFAPLLAILLGVIILTTGSLVMLDFALTVQAIAGVVWGAILTGIVSGATATGLYNLGGKTIIRTVAGSPNDQ